jgi:hypothetical protein
MSDTEFAKSQLRDHLAGLIVPSVSGGLWSIYDSSKELCARNRQNDQIIRTFQNMLTKIPEWSDTVLTTEVERIVKTSRCGYLDDLVMGVFIAYMKSFASLHYRGKATEVSVDFERPTLNQFIHHMYIHSARKAWQVAYLFNTVGVSSEQEARNRQEIETIVRECMEKVIHSFLPWEAITKSLAQPQTAVDDDSDSDDEQDESKKVQFADDSSEDSEDDTERQKVTLSDDVATIDIQELDAPEEDPLKEIEKNMKESLVLKL